MDQDKCPHCGRHAPGHRPHTECQQAADIYRILRVEWPEAVAFARQLHEAKLIPGVRAFVSLHGDGHAIGANTDRAIIPYIPGVGTTDAEGRGILPKGSLALDRER